MSAKNSGLTRSTGLIGPCGVGDLFGIPTKEPSPIRRQIGWVLTWHKV
jgi:hypothetical protein